MTNQGNNDKRGTFGIPTDSKSPFYAGICMIAALLLLITRKGGGFSYGLLSAVLSFVPMVVFIIIAFLPKKNVKTFIIPIGLRICLPMLHMFAYGAAPWVVLFCIALLIVFLIINIGKEDKRRIAICVCGAIAGVVILINIRTFIYVAPDILFFVSYLLLALGLDNDPNKEYYVPTSKDA